MRSASKRRHSKACFCGICDFDKARPLGNPASYSWSRIAALSVVYATDKEIVFLVASLIVLLIDLI